MTASAHDLALKGSRCTPAVLGVAATGLGVLVALTGCGPGGQEAAATTPTTSVTTTSVTTPATPTRSTPATRPASSHPVTLWRARSAPCPTPTATQAAAGKVLPSDGGCVRLVERSGTFDAPLHATTLQRNGQWWVEVTLDPTQAKVMSRVSRAEVGHRLAIVADDTVITAPVVKQPITGGGLQISATSQTQAKHTAALLTGA